ATLDLLSAGRAEMVVGRGSSIEAFPLFGYDLNDYDALFAGKLDLLLQVRANEHVTWSGEFRPPLSGQGVYPRPVQDPLPVWLGVGGTPALVRACRCARAAADGRDHRRRPAAVSAAGGSVSRGGSTRRAFVRAIARRRTRARVRGAEYETGCRRICAGLHRGPYKSRSRAWLGARQSSPLRRGSGPAWCADCRRA